MPKPGKKFAAAAALVDRNKRYTIAEGFKTLMASVEARKTKSGVLLNPEHPMEGELLGIKPPRSAVGPMPKGRGLLVLRGAYLPVQVPMPDR